MALLDGDTIPHATWLRELAAPLQDPRVGVASGNRWYMPAERTAGSLVRYLWNAAAVVQMYFYDAGWGGSLAFKTRLLRETDQRQLANAFGDDIVISRCARQHGYRLAFAPSLMMLNRETSSVTGPGFPGAATAEQAPQSLVVGGCCPRRFHDRHSRRLLASLRGGRGNRRLERGRLDGRGRGGLLGFDGRDGSTLGMARAADRAGSRRNDHRVWSLGMAPCRVDGSVDPNRSFRGCHSRLFRPRSPLLRRSATGSTGSAGAGRGGPRGSRMVHSRDFHGVARGRGLQHVFQAAAVHAVVSICTRPLATACDALSSPLTSDRKVAECTEQR